MNRPAQQLDLFHARSLNPTYEIKRAIRLGLSRTHLSRDQVVDEMNRIAIQEGLRKSVSKASLDNWAKDSDPERLPSTVWLTIFCKVIGDVSPIAAMLRPLGADIIDGGDQRLLGWAKAELEKRKAVRKAKNALSIVEDM